MNTDYARLRNNQASKQTGVSLVIVLVFLIMLTLVGATSMQTAGVEERMAANGRDRTTAFEAAETALRIGEAAVSTAYSPSGSAFTSTCANGLCSTGAAPDPNTYTKWSRPNTDSTILHYNITASDATHLLTTLAYSPGYYAEWLGSLNIGTGTSHNVVRVTAHAFGRDANTEVTLQSLIYF
jgi:type IV pilus assembly protein PilX